LFPTGMAGTIAIKDRHRSELPGEDLPEKLPGVVEPVGKLAGRATSRPCRAIGPGGTSRCSEVDIPNGGTSEPLSLSTGDSFLFCRAKVRLCCRVARQNKDSDVLIHVQELMPEK